MKFLARLASFFRPESADLRSPGTAATPQPVDLPALRELVGGDDDFMRELIDTFIASGEATLARITQALPAGDLSVLRSAAHSLKGAAANCRAGRLAACAEALEQSAANADHAGCQAAAAQIREEFQRTTTFLRSAAS